MAEPGEAMGDLLVNPQLTIPEAELELSFQTSGGPGGQHANRSATGVTLVWHYATSVVVEDGLRARLAANLGARGAGGRVRVVADKNRSQWRNRTLARSRLGEIVDGALQPPKTRRPTKPSRAARQRRIDQKKRTSAKKAMRNRPELD